MEERNLNWCRTSGARTYRFDFLPNTRRQDVHSKNLVIFTFLRMTYAEKEYKECRQLSER